MDKTEKKFIFSLLFLAIVGFLFWTYYNGREERSFASQTSELGNTASCAESQIPILENTQEEFEATSIDRAAGKTALSGRIVTRELTIWEQPVEAVYFAVDEEDSAFYSHYRELVNTRNAVNQLEGDILLFKIGIREGRLLISTASISERAQEEIFNALQSGEEISLLLEIPVYMGTEAPASFSFACAIRSDVQASA